MEETTGTRLMELVLEALVLFVYVVFVFVGLSLAVGIVAPLVNFNQGFECVNGEVWSLVTECFNWNISLKEYLENILYKTPAISWLGLGFAIMSVRVVRRGMEEFEIHLGNFIRNL